jgi:hypothetical protein
MTGLSAAERLDLRGAEKRKEGEERLAETKLFEVRNRKA